MVATQAFSDTATAPTPQAASDSYPDREIGAGRVTLDIEIPDPAHGYYRGDRFDWSGQIAQATWKGHTFFGPWRSPHDPTDSESAIGPAEEFAMEDPPGFAQAGPGEGFLKIGVGILAKGTDPVYRFSDHYPILDHGTWITTSGPQWCEMVQTISHGPWGYRYTKRITAMAHPAGFIVSHTLVDTGSSAIACNEYCHNFVIIDHHPIGSSYRIDFPFAPTLDPPCADLVTIQGDEIVLRGALHDRPIWCHVGGEIGLLNQSPAIIEDHVQGIGLAILPDRAPIRLQCYGLPQALSIEPFIMLSLTTGTQISWSTSYHFFAGGAPRAAMFPGQHHSDAGR